MDLNRFSVETILRSRNKSRPDKILSTFLCRYPRIIHAEVMTHRALTKNSASSRAIPISKMIRSVLIEPFIPLHWGKNQKGMQAKSELSGFSRFAMRQIWNAARYSAVAFAWLGSKTGVHKQVLNRLLEPFMYHTVLISGTEWSNFIALRDHPDAEPHINILAKMIRSELDRTDNIQDLKPGEWHLPFVTENDKSTVWYDLMEEKGSPPSENECNEKLIKKAVACSASTSYKTVDGFEMSLDKAYQIHDKLLASVPIHASPAEHVAFADYFNDVTKTWHSPNLFGNFVGFSQYRKTIPGETQ